MKENKGLSPRVAKIVDNVLLFGLAVAIIGAALKLRLMPYANQLLMVGIGTIINCVLVKYLSQKSLEGYLTALAISTACLAVLAKLMHWPNSQLLIQIAIVTAIVWGAKTLFLPVKEKEDE